LGRGTGEAPGGFGERQSPRLRAASAHYLAGLAHLGLGETELAKKEFETALESAPDSLGAKIELVRLK
jgi:Tfp pilus assembly protein PilF